MKLTVGVKILLGFILALVIQVAIAAVTYSTMTQLVKNAEHVTHTYEVLGTLETLQSSLKDAETGQRGFLLFDLKKEYEKIEKSDEKEKELLKEKVKKKKESFLEPYEKALIEIYPTLDKLKKLTDTNEKQQAIIKNDLWPLNRKKLEELADTIQQDREGKLDKALERVKSAEGKQYMDDFRSAIKKMQDEENRLLHDREKEALAKADLALNTILYGTAIAFVLVALVGFIIQRSISVPLRGFMGFVERIGTGDLTQKAPPASGDEVGKLGEMLDQMVLGLRDLAGQTRTATENLNSASAEILASVQQQVAGTREQAASVQEITATIEEVSQSGSQISERAKQVAASAEATASTTTQGLQSVQIATRSMEAIREQVETFAEHIVALSEKTQAVGEIIAAVTDIAERSNLLALNAAIEAAGAGEQGSRFAVVASEMKNLADQAKESTVQVQSILGAIQKGINSSVMLTEEAVKRAEAGREQAGRTEGVIRQMADTTQESVRAFQQIIAATNQQQIGLDQVTQGMKDIRQAAGQTATASAQLEKAVASVNALSQQLQRAAGRYKM